MERDQRRRSRGQNFLVDTTVIDRLVESIDVAEGELIVEIGPGRGALTLPLARAGARVMAVEFDPVWARRLRHRLTDTGVGDRVQVIERDVRAFAWPAEPYRVVANPPFNLTTTLLRCLLDRPGDGPSRADLVVQFEVARKRAHQPPSTLKSAGWAPWWTFAMGQRIARSAFRPVPRVDAAVLTIHRRDPPVLPSWLAPQFTDVLRDAWDPPRSNARAQ